MSFAFPWEVSPKVKTPAGEATGEGESTKDKIEATPAIDLAQDLRAAELRAIEVINTMRAQNGKPPLSDDEIELCRLDGTLEEYFTDDEAERLHRPTASHHELEAIRNRIEAKKLGLREVRTDPITVILPKLHGVRAVAGDKYKARCPAHADHDPSLSLSVDAKRGVRLRCWAGCSTESVVRAIGLEVRDLFARSTWHAPERTEAPADEPEEPEPAPPAEVHTLNFRLTDSGNAERLVARFRDRIRYCPPRKRWLIWDGKRWAWDQVGEIDQLAKRTVRAIYGEAEHARDADHAKAIASHAHSSERRDRRNALIALAQSEPGIPVLPASLDADPWVFNASNGTIDLRTGKLRPHDRENLITKGSPVEFVPGATHPLWDRYLADASGGDVELIAYLQRMAGYALQGRVTEKSFWFLFGPPDGTKSTFISAVAAAFGDYAVTADFSTWLVQSNTGGNRGDLVALMGARLVTSVEVRKGAKFDESIMKRITGGDALTAAAKYEAEITFMPSFALWLAANDAPEARDDDEGFWRRVRRIPFTNPIPKARQDPDMPEKLRAPEVLQAILAWAVEGCLRWRTDGMGTCTAVEASTAAYRAEMDRAAGFFSDSCAFGKGLGYEVTNSELRVAYENWCEDNGMKPLSAKDFAGRLTARGCKPATKVKGNNRGWEGLRLQYPWQTQTN